MQISESHKKDLFLEKNGISNSSYQNHSFFVSAKRALRIQKWKSENRIKNLLPLLLSVKQNHNINK